MAHYRLAELIVDSYDASATPKRKWGHVTELARIYDVSRIFLYNLRERAFKVLAKGLASRTPGPQVQAAFPTIDKAFIFPVV